jgi:hypothetical protein
MRATGFGIRSPADKSGEYLIPMRKPDGTNMDYNYKSISEHRREALFHEKLKSNTKSENIKDVIGKKFSSFSKADRFGYIKVSSLLIKILFSTNTVTSQRM